MILGYSLVFIASWVASANNVLNRALKGINCGVIMFWHGALGIIIALTAVCVDYFMEENKSGLKLFSYSTDVYWLILGATILETIAVNSMTIAY